MFQLPFHDGRSFAIYLRERAKDQGLSTKDLFRREIIEEGSFYKYLSNKREPKLSTVYEVCSKLAC